MKRLSVKILYTLFFLLLTICILTHSQISLYYAFTGLELWYTKMIPALLPFMIISGIMVRLHLTESFSTVLYPVVRPLFQVSKNVCYAMIMGFLCGFPMGAKTVYDLYSRQMINKREAEYLLAFCNNIGPVYFCSFVLPLLHRRLVMPYVFGMYGIPLLYGLFLRYSFFRDLTAHSSPQIENRHLNKGNTGKELSTINAGSSSLLYEIDDAIQGAVQSILSLGGYMILFNLLNLLPHILNDNPAVLLAPLFEITGGISMLKQRLPLYTLLLLPFGGFSCIAQTYSCIKNTSLSICSYTIHKIVLMLLTAVYYFCWFLLFPKSFMR